MHEVGGIQSRLRSGMDEQRRKGEECIVRNVEVKRRKRGREQRCGGGEIEE
jgi:hypothetical protein